MPTTPPFRAVLFDFDGTLADSYAAITASVNHVRGCHGLPPMAEDEVRGLVGHGIYVLMDRVVPGGDVEADAALYRAHHPGVMAAGTRLMPGAAGALAALRRGGVRLAVCSNKPVRFTRELLGSLGVVDHFNAILGPEDVGGRAKPDPAMLLAAVERLGARPAEALYVGDMFLDVQTARAAGLTVWVVPTGSQPREELAAAGADRVLDGLGELARLWEAPPA
jgi:phosphoglycolate phosphatase